MIYVAALIVGIALAVALRRTDAPELLALMLLTTGLVFGAVTAGGLVRVRLEQRARRRVSALLRGRGDDPSHRGW